MTKLTTFCPLLACVIALSSVAAADDDGWTSLFNGSDLTGWRGNTDYWSVKDGAITATTTPDNLLTYNTFCIWEGGRPGDFLLRARFRIVGGNSGIQYRSRVIDEAKFVVSGYQADIDSSPRYSGINYEEKARGILAERGQLVEIAPDGSKNIIPFADAAELQKRIREEEWNDYLLVARGNHLQHFINGTLMSEVIDHQSDKAAKSGIIALQAHQGPPMLVQFKDIELKELR